MSFATTSSYPHNEKNKNEEGDAHQSEMDASDERGRGRSKDSSSSSSSPPPPPLFPKIIPASNPEWVFGGRLGPFTVAEPVHEGSLTVIACFAHRKNLRHLMRFDPPNGLAFAPHNQTESGFIEFYTRKGEVDPANLPEVSCHTIETAAVAAGGGGASNNPNNHNGNRHNNNNNNNNNSQRQQHQQQQYQQHKSKNFHRNPYGPYGARSAAAHHARIRDSEIEGGALNSSQLAFLFLVLSGGLYYLYSKHLAHWIKTANANYNLKSITAAMNNNNKKNKNNSYNNNNNNNNHQTPRNHSKKNKGGRVLSKTKKSGGKKSGRSGSGSGGDSGTETGNGTGTNGRSKDSRSSSFDHTKATTDEESGNQPNTSKENDINADINADEIVGLNLASAHSTSDVSSIWSVDDSHTTSASGTTNSKRKHNTNNNNNNNNNRHKNRLLHQSEGQSKPADADADGKDDWEIIEKTAPIAAAAAGENYNTNDNDAGTTTHSKDLPIDGERIENSANASATAVAKQEENAHKEPPEELAAYSEKTATIPDEKTKEEQMVNQKSKISPLSESSSSSSLTIKTHEGEESITHEASAVVAEEISQKKNHFENNSILTTTAVPAPTAVASTISASSSASSSSSSSSKSSKKQQNTITIIVLDIEGMTCGGCVKVVNKVLGSFAEIDSVVTDLRTCTSTLSCNVRRLNLLPILTALDDVGMQAYLQSQSVAAPAEANREHKNESKLPGMANANASVGMTATAPVPVPPTTPCLLVEQKIRQQAIGAIGRPLLAHDNEILAPPGFERATNTKPNTNTKTKTTNPLSLMDELREGSTPLRRYQCSCGCEGCICSARQLHANDQGTDISLTDLCHRLQTTLGTSGDELEESFRETGGSAELRDKILQLSFPCGCSSDGEE